MLYTFKYFSPLCSASDIKEVENKIVVLVSLGILLKGKQDNVESV